MRQEWNDDRIDVLDRKVDDGFRRVDTRFDQVEEEIGQIKEEIGQIKGEIGEVRGELKALRDDVGSRLEGMHHTMLQFCVGALAILGAMVFTLAGIALTQV